MLLSLYLRPWRGIRHPLNGEQFCDWTVPRKRHGFVLTSLKGAIWGYSTHVQCHLGLKIKRMVCWTMQYIPQWIFMDFQGTLFSEKPTYNYLQMLIITARLYHLQLAPVEGNKTKFAGQKRSQNSKSHSYGLEKNVLISPPKKWGLRPMDKAICGDSPFHISN